MGVFVAVGPALPASAQSQATTKPKQVWEYLIVREDDYTAAQQLNDAGANGWELVSVVCTTSDVNDITGSIGGGGTDGCWYYFKRPK